MAQKYLTGSAPTVHRIDLPCDQTGFRCPPPHDVHVKFLPNLPPRSGWTLLAHAAAGKPDAVARWLAGQGFQDVRVEPGLAPKLLRATAWELPEAWAAAASFAKVHHLDLAADGHASWFVEGAKPAILEFVQDLERRQGVPLTATAVRCRPVHERRRAPISRRQFEALSAAVAMGYYDIPHRIDLRALAAQSGISLGSLSELLRRAEAAVLTHYVDSSLMGWPVSATAPPNPFQPVESLLEPVALRRAALQREDERTAAWPLAAR
jgi:hypothetical protein